MAQFPGRRAKITASSVPGRKATSWPRVGSSVAKRSAPSWSKSATAAAPDALVLHETKMGPAAARAASDPAAAAAAPASATMSCRRSIAIAAVESHGYAKRDGHFSDGPVAGGRHGIIERKKSRPAGRVVGDLPEISSEHLSLHPRIADLRNDGEVSAALVIQEELCHVLGRRQIDDDGPERPAAAPTLGEPRPRCLALHADRSLELRLSHELQGGDEVGHQ